MEDKIFKQDAKSIVDMLFDAKLFKEQITRDDLNSVEDFVGDAMNSRFNSYLKIKSLMDKLVK